MNEREHVPYHERRLEQQMLDALLRIEEILSRAFPAPGHTDLMVAPEDIDTFVEDNPPPKPKGKRR
jgi:hypothetical protein